MRQTNFFTPVLLTALLVLVGWPALAVHAAESEASRPARSIQLAVEYPGIEIGPGEDFSMDVIFRNKGRSDERLNIWLEEVPEGWNASIQTYRFKVSGIYVKSGEDATLTFEAQPGEQVQPGEYRFLIAARTADDRYKMRQAVVVRVSAEQKEQKDSKGVKLNTSYPVLRGPSDAEFEFSIEVDSKLDEDAVFDLFAQPPDGWEVNFKPAYESKFISSLRLKANQSSTVAVQVKPPAQALTGEYPIDIRVSSGAARADARLVVHLTGTYDLDVGTPNGLLSLDANPGKQANLSIYVKNSGSAVNNQISFMSFKPENWKIAFSPEKIASLKPGELKQVEITITPYEDALVGDYSINVKVDGERVSKNNEFRVTVKASAAWSWIGIAVIAAVVGGLTFLFRKLGRR
jgi:uncharacterized membrane protein